MIFNSDMGFMDESGYLFINGRIKDMIIRGGENIYPKEIEDFLMSNPFIADAHVIDLSNFLVLILCSSMNWISLMIRGWVYLMIGWAKIWSLI